MNTRIHSDFNAADADVTFQSSDGVLFRLHRKNLETQTGAFPGQEFKHEVDDEAVQLSELACDLEILFQFVYPKKHPNLEDKDFRTVAAVAEAVEKYEIFSAMNTCIYRLKHYLPGYPFEVLVHGIKHDYPDLINEAALRLVFITPISVAERLPFAWILPWLRFQQVSKNLTVDAAMRYIDGLKKTSLKKNTPCYYSANYQGGICNICRASVITWIAELTASNLLGTTALESATEKSHLVYLDFCDQCSDSCTHMHKVAAILADGVKQIPSLTSFFAHTTIAEQ